MATDELGALVAFTTARKREFVPCGLCKYSFTSAVVCIAIFLGCDMCRIKQQNFNPEPYEYTSLMQTRVQSWMTIKKTEISAQY